MIAAIAPTMIQVEPRIQNNARTPDKTHAPPSIARMGVIPSTGDALRRALGDEVEVALGEAGGLLVPMPLRGTISRSSPSGRTTNDFWAMPPLNRLLVSRALQYRGCSARAPLSTGLPQSRQLPSLSYWVGAARLDVGGWASGCLVVAGMFEQYLGCITCALRWTSAPQALHVPSGSYSAESGSEVEAPRMNYQLPVTVAKNAWRQT